MKIGGIALLFACFFSDWMYGMYMGDFLSPAIPADGLQAAREQPVEFRLGYEGDRVWERTFKSGSRNSDAFSSYSQLGSAALAIKKRFLMRFVAGGTNIDFTWRSSEVDQWRVQSHQNITIGGSGQAIIYQFPQITLGASASFQKTFFRLQNQTLNATPTTLLSKKGKWSEWQVGFGVSKKIDFLVPYLGIVAGNSYLNVASRNWQAKNKIGLVVGCSLVPFGVLALHAEIRIFNENAGTLAGEISF